ncbi:MAG: ATP-binding cassette domain-containing protein [Clostridiales bacterium]|nr:ATP-binding cassette domain-containing protein [Clostridiales bacterium]
MRFETRDLGFYYEKGKWIFRHINLCVESGERVGLVAPSGYGKSTLSRLIAGYLKPAEGAVYVDGKPLPEKGYCPIQLIYQHPEKAIDPYWTMNRILNECWEPDDELLKEIGIEKEWFTRRPHELSGGEMQRFCIARVLGPGTRFILADEISTMLDAITQAQIWQFLLDQVKKRDLGMMVITHNQALADRVCTRIIDLEKLNRNG